MAIPKYKKLKRYLLDDIRGKLPGDTLPTVAGLRQQFSISQATVERALNELRAEGLISSRRGSGIFVAERARMRQIALLAPYDIFDSQRSEFPRLLLHSLQGQASQRRTLLRHYIPSGSGNFAWDLPFGHLQTDIRNKQIDGGVAVELWNPTTIDWQIPMVGMEALPTVKNRVVTDRMAVIRKSVPALAARGCRTFGMIGDGDSPNKAVQREAFAAAVADAGGEIRPEWYGTVSGERADQYMEAGRRYVDALQSLDQQPDGIVSLDDYVTRGILDRLAITTNSADEAPRIATQANRGSIILRDAQVIRVEFDPDHIATALLDLLDEVTEDGDGDRIVHVKPKLVTD